MVVSDVFSAFIQTNILMNIPMHLLLSHKYSLKTQHYRHDLILKPTFDLQAAINFLITCNAKTSNHQSN